MGRRFRAPGVGAVLMWLSLWSAALAQGEALPAGFVDVAQVIPNIHLELRYCSSHNFVGRPIDGYVKPRCILTREAAAALLKVQTELNAVGLGLKVYDAYRPQRAVAHFVRWAQDLTDTKMKREFYPRVDKADLFKEEYIMEKSSHSRGSTVDLAIINLGQGRAGEELDMGTGFDLFGPESWPDYPNLAAAQRAHRLLLQTMMKKHGFAPYPKEWWHFTLQPEPFPQTYFDFRVE